MPDIIFDDYRDYRGASLGFLPAAAAAGSAAGPVGTVVGVVVGAIGSLFKLFGGGDDQATDYRPPADAASRFVQFDDDLSSEYIAFDMGPASIANANAKGNRTEDIYSYYSVFVSNSTQAGASPAAAEVIKNTAKKHGVSLSRAAEIVLTVAGVTRIAQPFLKALQTQPQRPQPQPMPQPQPPRPPIQMPAIRPPITQSPIATTTAQAGEPSPWVWIGLGALALVVLARRQ